MCIKFRRWKESLFGNISDGIYDGFIGDLYEVRRYLVISVFVSEYLVGRFCFGNDMCDWCVGVFVLD